MNTTYFLNLVSGNVYGTKKTPAIPDEYYIGLSSTAPSTDGLNVTEPASGGYQRVQLTGLSEPTAGVVTNPTSINFPESTQSWGTVSYFVIFDAATEGNLLMYGELEEARTVEAATIMTLRANSLTLSVLNAE